MNGLRAIVAASALGLLVPRAASAQPMSTTPELAYDLGQLPNARAIAMGGALNALGVSNVAMALNPANMTLARVYHIEALAAFSPEAKRQTYGLSIVDSVLNGEGLAGGLEGTWSTFDPDGINRTWTDVRAGAALPFGGRFAIGATGRYLSVQQATGTGPFGADLVSGGTSTSPLFSTITFDVGATALIVDGLRFGVVGHNLTNPSTGLAPTTGAAGLGFTTGDLSLEVDGLVDFTTYHRAQGRIMAGGELFLADRYPLRAGWRYDGGTNVNTASLGLGYVDPRWSVEFGVSRDLIGDHASTVGVLSLRYFYDTTGGASTPADQPDPF